jgi:rSAM/selenodomain-associated transferase 1
MNNLIVLLKNPIIGKAKTRIAARVGDEIALTIYKELLDELKVLLDSLDKIVIHLFFSDNIENIGPFNNSTFPMYLQSGADLGQRMLNAASDVKGNDITGRIVIIGSDCPYMQKYHIENAFVELNNQKLVLGPSEDGGYYLIGFQEINESLFNEILWSTGVVMSETIEKAKAIGWNHSLLPILSDIDTYPDYLAWKSVD